MANEKRLIDANALVSEFMHSPAYSAAEFQRIARIIHKAPTVDAVEVVHGERLYNAHEVAVIIADLFRDDCACNFNSIDEWLPFKCELQDACPNPVGVACWEQYLKYRDAKMDGERKDNEHT